MELTWRAEESETDVEGICGRPYMLLPRAWSGCNLGAERQPTASHAEKTTHRCSLQQKAKGASAGGLARQGSVGPTKPVPTPGTDHDPVPVSLQCLQVLLRSPPSCGSHPRELSDEIALAGVPPRCLVLSAHWRIQGPDGVGRRSIRSGIASYLIIR